MEYQYAQNQWKRSGFESPNIPFLKCNNRYYAVVEDFESVILVASKTEAIYAIVKSKVYMDTENGFPIYMVENPYYLRVVSCTVDSIKTVPIQNFVLNQIVPLLK